MNGISIKAYAKINLSLDVTGKRSDGFHTVETVMQQIDLHDEVLVRSRKNYIGKSRITVSSNKGYIPTDMSNVAYKAAALMNEHYRRKRQEGIDIRIDIKKQIFVSAGLAGGSSNAAAVVLGLNKLWDLKLSVKEMCELGAELGSDVPFCIMGQAKLNGSLGEKINNDPLACTCVLAEGTGTEMTPTKGIDAFLLLSKPPLSISTRKAYEAIDEIIAASREKVLRPDTGTLIRCLESGREEEAYKEMINLFELYTVESFDAVKETKERMARQPDVRKVLMSGTGPTLFSIYKNKAAAEAAYHELAALNKETCLARTLR